MRNTSLTLFRLLLAMSSLAAGSTLAASPLDGAWRLESGSHVDADGKEKDYASLKLQGTKLLADGRFSFTTAQDGRFWAGGSGRFTADADTYVETPEIASYPLVDGGSYRFRYTLEGDTWTLERYEDGKRVEREVWRRVTSAP
ncbi:hypothetical protein [Pseudoxanthomonas sp. PXM02]|uniref:hypothetical protein n=1 Tax=Pseudoxanthomonas sp. PXM02 TaxID=2769294 RepID=UPI00178484FF|nr:hypothetical protein [Pseudoxanthomonas sp. PXM02]MBD9479577.1 hypothetical protein [Pseudoxanthomonas sp. PXM02]